MLHLNLIKVLQDVFGKFPGVRSSHAKGIFVKGQFTPSSQAKDLCLAPHFNKLSIPVIARFSLFTGIPDLASTDPRANPHGLAVRFLLGSGPHSATTDIVCHASPLFPGATGEEVLAFFESLRDNTIEEYMKTHPDAAAFVQENRPTPRSFADQTFYSINAFMLTNADGAHVFVRYRWIPTTGSKSLTLEELSVKDANFLFDELPGLLDKEPICFKLVVQIAEEGDVTDNCTIIWPEERNIVEMGELKLEKIMEKAELPPQDKTIIFSPIPNVEGIEPSADPILAARSAVYSSSGQARRAAESSA
ncbi:catalase-like domain-containing protein [Xylogone sp. PMI_703]|nr:catalase-like domain-containing protein [Xylogone sp. PMI_703]